MSAVNWTYPTHYAPNATTINDLNFVINGTGAPGIYNSSYTPDALYGTYNWCNMPHARSREYITPSSDYTLAYVEVIHRHHKRTPYASNTFFKEDVPWDCSLNGPFVYGKNATGGGSETVPVSWQGTRDSANPFVNTFGPGFVNSSCQLPQMTAGGLEDAWVHGSDLRALYHDKLGFLPDELDHNEVSFRVTNNVITSQVVGGIVHGLFPKSDQIGAYIQSSSYDSLEPAYSCNYGVAIRTNYTGTNPTWVAHLNASASLYAKLDNVSGTATADTAGWHTSWDHYYDNLSAKQCHGKTLPCSTNNTAICVNQTDANTVYRLGNYEYSYYYRDAANSTAYSALRYGAFFLELKSHLQNVVSGASPMKYRHNVAHDGSISPILGLLQIDKMVWPGMGSEVIFELWKKSGAFYVRVLWGGQPMQTSTPLGKLDMIPMASFISYIDAYVPSNLVAVCNKS